MYEASRRACIIHDLHTHTHTHTLANARIFLRGHRPQSSNKPDDIERQRRKD